MPSRESLVSGMKKHKFWTSVIGTSLFSYALFSIIAIFIGVEAALIGYDFVAWPLMGYTFIGGLIWSVQVNKPGSILITLGASLLLFALYLFAHYSFFIMAGVTFMSTTILTFLAMVIPAVAGISFLLPGIKHYKHKPQNSYGHLQTADEIPAGNFAGHEGIEPLTVREKEVINLIVAGKDNNEIAATLGISKKTVKNYINNIYSKLQVKSRYEVISYILKNPGK